MKIVLSPAKKMKQAPRGDIRCTVPSMEKTPAVAASLAALPAYAYGAVLRCNERLAYDAFAMASDFGDGVGQTDVLTAFSTGIVYRYLDPATFTPQDYAYAGEHLFVLSAMYGALRATDGVRPYRLDLESRLTVEGQSLQKYWGRDVYEKVFTGQPVVNLASKEYSALLTPYKKQSDTMITCHFYRRRGGKLSNAVVYIKMARGRMARAIIKNRWTDPAQLALFSEDGYRLDTGLSDKENYVFVQE